MIFRKYKYNVSIVIVTDSNWFTICKFVFTKFLSKSVRINFCNFHTVKAKGMYIAKMLKHPFHYLVRLNNFKESNFHDLSVDIRTTKTEIVRKNQHFFCQINVFTKELISRKIFVVLFHTMMT